MNELKELRKELEELKKLLGSLCEWAQVLPSGAIGTHPENILDEINRLCGFVDCMIIFDIKTFK